MLAPSWTVSDLRAHPELVSPEEDGATFEANARIKAETASLRLPGVLVLSDDSGLEVDVLLRAPGVHSARYAGPKATDKDNRDRLKCELAIIDHDVPGGWRARFRCAMAVAMDGKTIATFDGRVEGHVIGTEQGVGGFGYDPLFVPDGYVDTFGVLPESVKNSLSHRSRALAQFVNWMAVER